MTYTNYPPRGFDYIFLSAKTLLSFGSKAFLQLGTKLLFFPSVLDNPSFRPEAKRGLDSRYPYIPMIYLM